MKDIRQKRMFYYISSAKHIFSNIKRLYCNYNGSYLNAVHYLHDDKPQQVEQSFLKHYPDLLVIYVAAQQRRLLKLNSNQK